MEAAGLALSPFQQGVYYKIRNVFPRVNSTSIKEIILNPQDYGINSTEDTFLNDITNYLVDNGDAYLDIENIDRDNNDWATSPDLQSSRLIEIFPDADPEFLTKFAHQNYRLPQVMNTFIEENFLKKNYPTREQYVARKKRESDFEKYFNNFNVNEFIQEFPEAVKYFEDRKCEESTKSFNLLCQLFKNLDMESVKKEYNLCNFNPSLTSKNLQKISVPVKFSMQNIQNLEEHMQEFAFICHRELIEEKLKNDAILSKNDFLNCETCLNDYPPSKCSICNNGHIFCNPCIAFGTECKIAEGIYSIKCFADCSEHFNDNILKKVLNPKLYKTLLKKQQEIALADLENVETCPFCECKSEIIKEDKIFKCRNEDCLKESCRLCRKINHLPHECADVIEIKKARLYVEEKMTKALIRICYNCNKEYVKEEGCNRMSCPCGAVSCYICDKPVPKDDYKHFNGQGSDRHDLCPLYSDDKYQEAEAVIEVARVTKNEILKKNPDFKIEIVDSLLPTLPAKSSGPHDQIPNANQLPEHALKVAKSIAP